MSTFDDFKVGECVAHISNGDGVVTAVDDCVRVLFDRKTDKGMHWVGAYDRRWFELNPKVLFHRSTP